MRYTIRNIRPSVLLIPDAGLRLEPGQTAVVGVLTPQLGALVAARALEVVTRELTPPAPPAAAAPVATPAPNEKRGKKSASALPVTMENADDAQ